MRHTIESSISLSSADLDSACDSAGSQDLDELSLSAILPNARFFSCQDISFRSIADIPQQCSPTDLVVYRIGEGSPEELIADAMARGAAGILTEQLLPSPLPQCIVGDVDLAVSQIHAEILGHPDRRLLTVGVIGPAGKTTTTLLVASLLRSAGIRTAYQTDLGDSDGVVQQTSRQPLPSGTPLLRWLSEAVDSQCSAALIEMSDSDVRYGRYDAIQFDLLILTGSERSDDYGPSSTQCALDRLSPTGVVVAPADDQSTMRVVRDSGVGMVTYGVQNAADMTAKVIEQSDGMTTLMMTYHDTTAIMETPLCGSAMAANHAAAAMVGVLVDSTLPGIVESLSKLRSVPGRGQQLASMEHANVIIDAAGSPARCAAALRTARSMKGGGRLWCVFAVDGVDDPQQLAHCGSLMERFATHSIICSVDQKKSFLKASHAVLDGVQKCAAMRLVADQRRAIGWAVGEAKPTDTILILGGFGGPSAHDQRSNLQGVIQCVESARTNADQPADSSALPSLSLLK